MMSIAYDYSRDQFARRSGRQATAAVDRWPARSVRLGAHLQIPESRHRTGHRHDRGRQRNRRRSRGGRRAPRLRRSVAHDACRRTRSYPAQMGGSSEKACRRNRRTGEPRRRQADRGGAAAGSPGGDRYADLLCGLGRQDQRRGGLDARRRADLYGARARRRGGGDRAVEFPADDRDVEACAGAGVRLHGRHEAGRTDIAVGAAHRRTRARSGPAAGRAQYRHRSGPGRRRRPRQSPRRRQGHVHGIAGRRPRDHARRGGQLQTRVARTRRQVRQRHLRRCRSRCGVEGRCRRYFLQCRAGVLGGFARAGAGEGV